MGRGETVFWVVILGYFLFGVVVAANGYMVLVYAIDRDVIAHLKYALAVNDAEAIYRELSLAYEGLESFHGNPKWFLPTATTDFDYIKMMLSKQIEAAKEFIDVDPNDYGYQRFLKNVYYAVQTILEMVEEAKWWIFIQIPNIIMFIIYLLGWPLVLKIADKLWHKIDYGKRWF